MKAIRMDRFGAPEVLEYVDVPEPHAGPGQVVIRVESVAVNWSDTMRRRGDVYPFPTELPFVPGGEVAGTIAAVGDGVDGLVEGMDVFALAGADGSGGYAQYAVANAAMVIPRPPSVGVDEASAILVAGGTAALLLREAVRLQHGESVLIEGAGGGVGSFAVQIATAIGAGTVIAAAGSADRRAAALDLGAHHAVDYHDLDWVDRVRALTGGMGVDAVLETVGGPVTSQALQTLAPFGRMAVYGYASGEPGVLSPEVQQELFYRPVLNQTVSGFNIGVYFGLRPQVAVAALQELIGWVAGGRVRVPIGAVLPLADAATAHRLLADRLVTGKIVLKPW